jgi:hypothetical protein
MAAEFKPEPAMHCTPSQCDEVSKLAHNLLDNGMYAHGPEFPDIPEDQVDFTTDLGKLDSFRVSAKGNSANTKQRNDYSKTMHKRLKSNLKYAKLICGNNINLIQLSGFDSSLPPEPATIPLTRGIHDIVKGPEQDMVTVILEPPSGTKKQRREHKTYIVRMYLTEEATEFTEGCVSSNTRKLFVRKVPKGVARYYQIVIQNSAGSNELATRVKFTLN